MSNKNLIDTLKQAVSIKTKKHENLISLNNIFGLFINDNTFLPCKEIEDLYQNHLSGFSTNDYLISVNYDFVHWRENMIFNLSESIKVFAIPIQTLLDKHCLNEITMERNLYLLYEEVNKYLEETPTFIQNLFKEIEGKSKLK